MGLIKLVNYYEVTLHFLVGIYADFDDDLLKDAV
jgi:hypothetical protein